MTIKFSSSTYAYVHQFLHLPTYLPSQFFICFIQMLSKNYISKWFLTIKRPKSYQKKKFLHTILFERIFCSKFEVFMPNKLGFFLWLHLDSFFQWTIDLFPKCFFNNLHGFHSHVYWKQLYHFFCNIKLSLFLLEFWDYMHWHENCNK